MPSDSRGGDPSGPRSRRELFADRDYAEERPRFDDRYDPEDEEDDYDFESRRRGSLPRRLLKGGLAALTAGVFVGVVWYAYLWGSGDGAGGNGGLPVVYLEDGPEKVRPEEPGGMDVPHQDSLVLNQSDGTQTTRIERLLPPPETPQPPQPLDDPAPRSNEPVSQRLNMTRETDQSRPTEPPTAEAPDFDMPETPPAPSFDAPASEAPVNEALPPRPEPQPARTARPTPEPRTEPAPDPQPETDASGFTVQLGAFRGEDVAREGWRRWQEAHAGILGDQRLILRSAEVEGQGTFWRVRTGPFPNRATAQDLCSQLEARGEACLVIAPR